jgi:hypothetical protein
MKARHELGVPVIQLGPAASLPEKVRTAYEDRVVAAARTVGGLYLADGNIPAAFSYLNMIGEVEPIRAAIAQWRPGEDDENFDAVIDIAVGHSVHPSRGLELVLDRYGTCQAITSCEQLLSQGLRAPMRDDCIKLLVRTLHRELVDRLKDEIATREGESPAIASIPVLMGGRDWLFADEAYHIDTSHLNSVVRMARLLPKCEELFLALQLCDYGTRLGPRYRYSDSPPFEDAFADSSAYFKTILGTDVEKGLALFRQRAEDVASENLNTYPAEIYVHLLQMVGRNEDAVQYAGRKLNRPDFRPSFGLSLNELCQTHGKFDAMANWARRRGDLLGLVAGVVQFPAKPSE